MNEKMLKCPHCNSTNYDYIGGYISDKNNQVFYNYECKCNNCKSNFVEVHKLTYIKSI